jgi:hypothetical protein
MMCDGLEICREPIPTPSLPMLALLAVGLAAAALLLLRRL